MAKIRMIPTPYPEPLLVGLSRYIPQHLYNGTPSSSAIIKTAKRFIRNEQWLPTFMLQDGEFTNRDSEAALSTDTRTLLLHSILTRGFPIVDTKTQALPPYGETLTFLQALEVVDQYADDYSGAGRGLYFLGNDNFYYLIGKEVISGTLKPFILNVRRGHAYQSEISVDEDWGFFTLVE